MGRRLRLQSHSARLWEGPGLKHVQVSDIWHCGITDDCADRIVVINTLNAYDKYVSGWDAVHCSDSDARHFPTLMQTPPL